MAGQPEEEPLGGGGSTQVVRRGDLVLRGRRPWSDTVVGLLRHLEARGFRYSPRPVGVGFSSDGREQLGFIPAASAPTFWSEEGGHEVGVMLRELHRSTDGYLPHQPTWMPWWGRDLPGSPRLIGHGDVAPWNLLARDGLPVALLDWDTSGPMCGVWDLAQAVWLNAQLHDEDVAARLGLPEADDRARLARAICEGYELSHGDRPDLVERMIELAVRTGAQEAIDAGVTPTGQQPRPMGLLGGGSPFNGQELLWAITWRTRSARWMLANRSLLCKTLS